MEGLGVMALGLKVWASPRVCEAGSPIPEPRECVLLLLVIAYTLYAIPRL